MTGPDHAPVQAGAEPAPQDPANVPFGTWLGSGEVCRRLGVNYFQLRYLRERGVLTSHRVGKCHPRFLETDVERLRLESITRRKPEVPTQ